MTIKELNKLYEVIDKKGIDEILNKYGLGKVDCAITWEDLNFDDLDKVEFIMIIEAKYRISIDNELAKVIIEMNFFDFYNRLKIKIRNDKLNNLGI